MAGDDQRRERGTLAQNVERLRKKRGWSQERLSAETGLRQATISDVESGEGNPEFETLECVARALNLTVRDLLKPPRRSRTTAQ
jgi:transcriptional regulator with XRE-family HTH domain